MFRLSVSGSASELPFFEIVTGGLGTKVKKTDNLQICILIPKVY
jgi:hypothetical protein